MKANSELTTGTSELVGTFTLNGKLRTLSVEQNASGTWTANDPWGSKDYKTCKAAVSYLKRTYAQVNVEWLA
jgi:hypothetical protein